MGGTRPEAGGWGGGTAGPGEGVWGGDSPALTGAPRGHSAAPAAAAARPRPRGAQRPFIVRQARPIERRAAPPSRRRALRMRGRQSEQSAE